MRIARVMIMLTALHAPLFAAALPPAGPESLRTVQAEWSGWSVVTPGVYAPDAWYASDPSGLTRTDTPDAVVSEDAVYADSHGGRDGVMLLKGLGYMNMDFYLPNYLDGDRKEIEVRLVYQALGFEPILGLDVHLGPGQTGQTAGIFGPHLTERSRLNDGWVSDVYRFVVVPNPGHEFVTLGFETSGGQDIGLDSVTIDAVCVPEPATMGLLALGVLGLMRKGKRSV